VRRIPIRIKLAAALAVPLMAMGLVTLIEVMNVADDARGVREQTDLATATIGPNGLITALQNERNWASAYGVGFDEQLDLEVPGFDATRAGTDDAFARFEQELDRRGEAARASYAPALEGLAGLPELRSEIDAQVAAVTPGLDNIGPTTELFDRYTALIAPFFGGMSRISIVMDDPELRQGASLTETVTRQMEIVPRLANALVLPVTASTGGDDLPGINNPAEIAKIAELQDMFLRQADTLQSATGPYAEIAAEYFPEEFNRTIDQLTSEAIATGQMDLNRFISGMDVPLDEAYLGYRDQVAAALQDRADELNASATSHQRWFGLLMAVTFGAAVVLTVVVSLSITRPLRSLMRQAKEMADRRLPGAVTEILDTPLGDDVVVPTVAPVRVATRDEVADVADALNTVQDSALDLAVEQAVLRRNIADSFVNLGRRNQNLLGRQLDFITELETNETDADALASLFRLDHLATRMRRNAESLLVLAGIEPPRQWAAPVQLSDVIRAALGEVEDYQRVTVRGLEPATVLGSAAADLAHLLAELVENAIVFSPPDQTVEIRGAHRAAYSPERPGYTLAIVDVGLGMPPHDIAASNRRLAGVESFTIAPSKYLGHYVAGNLAARHGIGVQLQSSPGYGVTVTVDLPPGLFTTDAHNLSTPAATPRPPRGLVSRAPRESGIALAAPDRAVALPTEAQLASLRHVAGRARSGELPVERARAPGAGAPPPLSHRDRGAQVPTTNPLSVRRTPPAGAAHSSAVRPDGPPGPSVAPGGPPPGRPQRAAVEVYGFLSSFTAGVQRGLEASRAVRGDASGG
jgi:signal transduction histidine kinase